MADRSPGESALSPDPGSAKTTPGNAGSPGNGSVGKTTAPAANPVSLKRRLVSWILILMLAVPVGLQFLARRGYAQVLASLTSSVKTSEETGVGFNAEQVQKAITGNPDFQSGPPVPTADPEMYLDAQRMDTYIWRGLFMDYGIRVYYGIGKNPEVLQVESFTPGRD